MGLFSGPLIFGGVIIGGNFAFQNGLVLTIKTANSNSPWAYIREGLLSEGYLRRRSGGLIFGEGLLSEFYGTLLTLPWWGFSMTICRSPLPGASISHVPLSQPCPVSFYF